MGRKKTQTKAEAAAPAVARASESEPRPPAPDPVPDPALHPASIAGTVTDESGHALPGAEIRAGEALAVANIGGEYLLLEMPQGDVTLEASLEGYQTAGANLTVRQGTRHSVSFTLTEEPAGRDAAGEDGPRQPKHKYLVLAQAVSKRFRVPASVVLAIWALESGWGEHMAARNNPFGIKAAGSEARAENGYAVFHSIPAAFFRAGQILGTREPYRKATEALHASKKSHEKRTEDYVRAIAASWAEDPDYAEKILTLLRSNDLLKYDQ